MIKCDLQPLGFSLEHTARIVRTQPAIWQAAVVENIDPHLMNGIAWVESRFNATAVSPAGASGMFQIMPATGRAIAQKLGISPDPWDPANAAKLAAHLVRRLLRRYDGDTRLALAAYNAGAGNVDKYQGIPPFKETQRYVPAVLAARTRFKKADDFCEGREVFDPSKVPDRPPRRPTRPTTPTPATPPKVAGNGLGGVVVLVALLALAEGF